MLQRPSRNLWIAAIVLSVGCVAGLGYALITDWNSPPDPTLHVPHAATGGGGFGMGLLVGIGAGIVIGSIFAIRSKRGS